MPTFANLPGATVEITDLGLRISKPPAGPKVILLGLSTSTEAAATPFVPYSVNDSSITYAYTKFKDADGTINELCKAMMEASSGGTTNIELMNILPSASGASIDDDARYGYLGTAYTTLFNYDVDIVVPIGANLNSSTLTGDRSFGYQLANFCYDSTANNNTAIGVIGVTAPTTSASGTPTLAEVETWVAGLEAYTNCASYDGTTDTIGDGVADNYRYWANTSGDMPASSGGDITDAKGNYIDIGAYISVVAGAIRSINEAGVDVYPTLGYYNSNGAAAYAGLIASLSSQSAPTNKVVNGIAMQQYLSLSQANRIAGARMVPIISKPKGVVAATAMTGAYNISQYYRSDFVRLTTVRIVHDAVNFVREVADQFIGEPNSAPQRNALSTAIEQALKAMQLSGALRRYDFNVYATATDQVLGRATVELELVPVFELTQITVYVALAAE